MPHIIGMAAFGAAAILLLLLVGDNIHTASPDLALHYSFSEDIAETWTWPMGDKPWTSGMGPYPPFAHYLAALSGLVTGSTFLAMHDIAVLSVFVCYFVLFRKLITLGNVAGTLAIIAASAVFVFLGSNRTVFGYEVFYNFFYAQMVGEAILLAFLYVLTLRRPSYAALGVTGCIVYALGWLYPQTAVLAALGYLSFEFLFLFRAYIRIRAVDRASLVRLVVAGVALPLAVAANPTFRYMIRVAANNGALDVGVFNGAIPALAAALVLSCGAMALLIRNDARWERSALFFAVVGLAAGAAALMQYFSLVVLHSGSDYAVRKFAYLVVGLLACIAVLLAAWHFAGKSGTSPHRLLVAFVPPTAAVAVICGLPMFSTVSMRSFLDYQATAIRMVRDSGVPAAMGDVASRNTALPWYLNNAVTLGDLKMDFSRSIAVYEAMFDPSKAWPEAFALLDDQRGILPRDCVRSEDEASAIKLVAVPCLKSNGASLQVGQLIDIKAWRSKPPYLASGWSTYEGAGIWAAQDQAKLKFRLPHDRPKDLALVLDGLALLTPNHPAQRITVTIDPNGPPLVIEVTSENQGKPIIVPIPNGAPDDITADLRFDDLVSLKSLGLSDNDDRKLGLFLRSFSVERAKG